MGYVSGPKVTDWAVGRVNHVLRSTSHNTTKTQDLFPKRYARGNWSGFQRPRKLRLFQAGSLPLPGWWARPKAQQPETQGFGLLA
jgi:hypothetical protein